MRVALLDEFSQPLEPIVELRQGSAQRLLHANCLADDVVGTTLLDQFVVGLAALPLGGSPAAPHDGALDAVAAAVREDEDTRFATQFVPTEGIADRHTHHMDPHVDSTLPHDPRQDHVELVAPNLVVLLDIGRWPGLPLLSFSSLLHLGQETEDEDQAEAAKRSRS